MPFMKAKRLRYAIAVVLTVSLYGFLSTAAAAPCSNQEPTWKCPNGVNVIDDEKAEGRPSHIGRICVPTDANKVGSSSLLIPLANGSTANGLRDQFLNS
jgi:hypothetical protein